MIKLSLVTHINQFPQFDENIHFIAQLTQNDTMLYEIATGKSCEQGTSSCMTYTSTWISCLKPVKYISGFFFKKYIFSLDAH